MTPRSRLLTRTVSMSSGPVPSTGLPVAASISLSSLVLMKTFLSLALNKSLASCSASISGAAKGLPLVATAVTASAVSE